ncbi:MAG: ferritin family protein [Bacillota bacterium]
MYMHGAPYRHGAQSAEAGPFGLAVHRALPGGVMLGVLIPGGMLPGSGAMPAPAEELQGLAGRIEGYLKDQATAAAFYRELRELTEHPTIRRCLTEAMEDEAKHYKLLQGLYRQLTGRSLEAAPGKESYASLREGLIKAADGEIQAYEAYKDEYQRFTDPAIRTLFFELFSDEIEHATRFNTALHILSGMG